VKNKQWAINEARAQGWGDRAEAFVEWQSAIDAIVTSKLHLGISDLPDWDFATAFEAGTSAADAAEQFMREVLDESGFDPDDFDL
jgi:hypothetical protein